MLHALPLALALFCLPQYMQRNRPQPPLPGYGLTPALPREPFSQQRSSIELGEHLRLAPRAQDQRSSRIQWLREASSTVQGVQPWPTGAEDFSDLQAFGKAIEGRRIVTLGEASHSDGAAFRIKARLVRYLHQVCGFDLIVFESGLFACDAAWRRVQGGELLQAVGPAALQPVWARSQTVNDLFTWMQGTLKSERPLRLAGMDLMPTGTYTGEAHAEITAVGTRLGIDPDLLSEGLAVLDKFPMGFRAAIGSSEEERAYLLTGLAEVGSSLQQASIAKQHDPELRRRAGFYAQCIQSFASAIRMISQTDFSNLEGDRHLNLRDEQMALNLEWLAKLANPASKIIVWGATSHLSRARSGLRVRTAKSMVPVGEHLERSMPGQVYHLGITAYGGLVGGASGATPELLEPAPRGSLEELLQATGKPAAFLDMTHLDARGRWLQEDVSSRAMGHQDVQGNWARALDGIYFVREAEAVIPLAQ